MLGWIDHLSVIGLAGLAQRETSSVMLDDPDRCV